MHGELDKFQIGDYEFISEFDTGNFVGGELSLTVCDLLGHSLLTRYFIFGNQQHLRAFANKFATDPAYRRDSLDGSARWARLERFYIQNSEAYYWRLAPVLLDEPADRARERAAVQKMRELYRLLDKHLEELEALPTFQEHVEIERQSPTPSMQRLDPGIERAVLLFAGFPDVVTQFSCEGIRRSATVDWWTLGPIWFPGRHQVIAHLQFEKIPHALSAALDLWLRERGVGEFRGSRAASLGPEHNAAFVAALEEFAEPRSQRSLRPEEILTPVPRLIETPPTPIEQQIAVWHFGVAESQAEPQWLHLTEEERFQVAREFNRWKQQIHQRSPRVALGLLLEARAVGLRETWAVSRKAIQFQAKTGRAVWEIAPRLSEKTGKRIGYELWHFDDQGQAERLAEMLGEREGKVSPLVEFLVQQETYAQGQTRVKPEVVRGVHEPKARRVRQEIQDPRERIARYREDHPHATSVTTADAARLLGLSRGVLLKTVPPDSQDLFSGTRHWTLETLERVASKKPET